MGDSEGLALGSLVGAGVVGDGVGLLVGEGVVDWPFTSIGSHRRAAAMKRVSFAIWLCLSILVSSGVFPGKIVTRNEKGGGGVD